MVVQGDQIVFRSSWQQNLAASSTWHWFWKHGDARFQGPWSLASQFPELPRSGNMWQSQNFLHGDPERSCCITVRMKSKSQWRHRGAGDAGIIGCLLREREAMSVAGMGLSKLFGAQTILSQAWDAGHGIVSSIFALVPPFLVPYFFLLQWEHVLCTITCRTCSLVCFYRGSWLRDCLTSVSEKI